MRVLWPAIVTLCLVAASRTTAEVVGDEAPHCAEIETALHGPGASGSARRNTLETSSRSHETPSGPAAFTLPAPMLRSLHVPLAVDHSHPQPHRYHDDHVPPPSSRGPPVA